MPLYFPIENIRLDALTKLANKRYYELTPAESEILENSASTQIDIPKKRLKLPVVRAEFLRWLATDKDAAVHIDPLGLRVYFASIQDSLTLDFCKVPFPLSFRNCEIHDNWSLDRAELATLRITECSAKAILAGGITIHKDLNLDGTKLDAVEANEGNILGSVLLRNGFTASDRINLSNAQIGGDLDCSGASILEIDCWWTQVVGKLVWVGIQNPDRAKLNLEGATAGTLHDERSSWPLAGRLVLNGFSYRDLILHKDSVKEDLTEHQATETIGLSPADRITWLRRQPETDLERPQPWLQLAKILEASGDSAGAKHVVYEYWRQQTRGVKPTWQAATFIYDQLEEKPLRVFVPIALLWFFGFIVFWRASRMKAMAPTDKEAFDAFKKTGEPLDRYAPFNPAIYALEIVLPVVKLGQDASWSPNPEVTPKTWFPDCKSMRWTRWLPSLNYSWLAASRWTLILLGWALALVLGAAISSHFKS